MDYSIGSLSDLITGSNTPNKKKVIKKQFSLEENEENDVSFSKGVEKSSNKKKKKTKKVENAAETSSSNAEENGTLVKKAKRKREFPKSNESEQDDTLAKKVAQKRKFPKSNSNGELKTDVTEENKVKGKGKNEIFEESPEMLAKTVFVGNLPITSSTKKIKRFFTKYGKVDTVRIRGIPVANPKTPKKVAIIKKEFHPERKSFFAFIRFESREDAIKATEANGILYENHHIRIHLCDNEDKPDENKAIFVGNLSFYAEEDDLWKLFEPCGAISSVRIVRDRKTGIGKGFGYVNFQSSDSVTLALEMEDVKLKDRELRISLCNINAAKKNKTNNKQKKISKPGKPKVRTEPSTDPDENPDEKQNSTLVTTKNESFQGVKLVEKKKKKFNKGLQQKKRLVKLIAPK